VPAIPEGKVDHQSLRPQQSDGGDGDDRPVARLAAYARANHAIILYDAAYDA